MGVPGRSNPSNSATLILTPVAHEAVALLSAILAFYISTASTLGTSLSCAKLCYYIPEYPVIAVHTMLYSTG